MRLIPSLVLLSSVIMAVACSSSSSKTTSTVEGKVAASSFALGAPSAVDAINESGARTRAKVNTADGSFRFEIAKGHVYRLVAVTPKGEEPIVFPRQGGRLDTTFRISSGAAKVSLGAVRHLDSAPTTGFAVKSATSSASSGNGAPGECVDGTISGTNTRCVDDDGKTSCENGQNGADDHADGECVNGKDAKTGQACTDGDQQGEVADPVRPMAVPERNPPNDVSGCDENEEEGDD